MHGQQTIKYWFFCLRRTSEIVRILGASALSRRRRLPASSCLSIHMRELSYRWTDFHEIPYWTSVKKKSVRHLQICLKSYNIVVHFTWGRNYVRIVDSSTKYFVTRQQCKVVPWLHYHGNSEHVYCWRLHVGQQYKANALLRLHNNSGYANAPQCYVIRTYIAYPVTLYISICHKLTWSRDSSVIIVTALWVWQPWDLGLISGRIKSFVLSKTVETGSGRTQSPIQRFPGVLCTGVKWSGREAEHSRLCSAEVNKGGAVPHLFHFDYRHDGHTATLPYQLLVLLTSLSNHFLTNVTDSWFSPGTGKQKFIHLVMRSSVLPRNCLLDRFLNSTAAVIADLSSPVEPTCPAAG
jgi:hypothetical protein